MAPAPPAAALGATPWALASGTIDLTVGLMSLPMLRGGTTKSLLGAGMATTTTRSNPRCQWPVAPFPLTTLTTVTTVTTLTTLTTPQGQQVAIACKATSPVIGSGMATWGGTSLWGVPTTGSHKGSDHGRPGTWLCPSVHPTAAETPRASPHPPQGSVVAAMVVMRSLLP
jgi:hypothetical protein